ncbi:MAG: PLD nuclease N-terminal domain-containing protein [Pseudomonas sp.]|uniref:PLD nuclease N-terminal domain-containing protein n=1 Tax=Pseudomonas sp. TaxID=306 RepID=UPI003D6FAA5D
MSSFLYDLVAFAIFVADIWAIIHVVKSSVEVLKKVLWVALIALLPVIGLIIWAIAGPRAKAR